MNPNIEQEKRTFLLRELERVLGPILSPRQSFRPVEDSIELLDPADYEFVEHWLKVTAASNVELAYVFACSIGTAQSKIGQKAVRVWLNQGLATYDREGLYPAIKAIQDIDSFKQK